MRLCLAVPSPVGSQHGAAVYDRGLVAGLRALGHEVAVAELDGDCRRPDDVALASATRALQGAQGARLLIDGACLAAFAPHGAALIAADAAALVHRPTPLESGRDEDRVALLEVERAMLPRFRRIVVTGADTAERLRQEYGVAATAVHVVAPGTPDAPRSPGPLQADGCLVLCVAALLPRKGHDVLLRALARLPDLAWSLAIVGGPRDPVYAQELYELAATLGIAARVRFAGELSDAALDALWQQVAVFALASRYETTGMAIAEALRRGVPVATTSGVPLATAMPAEAGVVAAPGDVAALSNALRRLIFDRELRRVMADAAWAHGRTLPDWPTQAARVVAALED